MGSMNWPQYWVKRLEQVAHSRNLSENTVRNYSLAVRRFLEGNPGPPSYWQSGTIKRFLARMQEDGLSGSSLNLYLDSLAFFVRHVCNRPECMERVARARSEQKLPPILSPEKVKALLESPATQKHRLALGLAYGCGLRVGELSRLELREIDFQRGVITIRDAKGHKDRAVMMPHSMQGILKDYIATHRPTRYLFEGKTPGRPLVTRSFQVMFHRALNKCGLKHAGGIHSLRHAFATHLLEGGTDLKLIQSLLGHSSYKTTERYARVASHTLTSIESPVDRLWK